MTGPSREDLTIFMCGDVMTGRGIDQVLPHPGDPVIHEPYLKSAADYVTLAEQKNGPIPKPVDCFYIWGDALAELKKTAPDARIVNLETAVTRSEDYEDKGINYRMNPDNIACITAAGIDCCSLANNHVLDWGYSGLEETLKTLEGAGLKSSGAGRNLREAQSPAVVEVKGKGRVAVFAFGAETSGIPHHWAAAEEKPGVNLLPDLSERTVLSIRRQVEEIRKPGDIVVASIHWGGNWGYPVAPGQREFAHRIIDGAGVDVIHGHSSHHVMGIEVYNSRLICYGCGDFINDYEGISGYESYRSDLSLMYFVTSESSTGNLVSLRMTPMQMKRFRVVRASEPASHWLQDTLNREGRKLGTRAELCEDNILLLRWD